MMVSTGVSALILADFERHYLTLFPLKHHSIAGFLIRVLYVWAYYHSFQGIDYNIVYKKYICLGTNSTLVI